MNFQRLYLLLAVLSVSVPSIAGAQQDRLSEDEQQAMQLITEKTVRATISFLASDELGGRDTPSKGLDIASAYVAARFRGAGLEPLGGKDSFYQTTEVATAFLPQSAEVKVGEESLNVLGVLGAGKDALMWTGAVDVVDDETPRDKQFMGAVTLTAPSFEQRRASGNFARKLVRLQQNGAAAILVQVAKDHPLVATAARSKEPRLIRTRGGYSVPVILIEPNEFEKETSISIGKTQFGKAEVKNVIGVLKGSDPELGKEAIIFSAHLDHIGRSGSVGDTINNGADDDATGVTAVLSLADAYAALKKRPKRSVIFMTFWGEEKGLLGSRHYVGQPTWPLEKTVANINLEMLGRPEAGANEKAWMTGWDQSDLGPLMATGAKRVGVLIFEHPSFSAMLYRASDNYSFVQKGVVGHSFSAGSLHDDYHKVTDEWERLELKHMTRVIEGLYAGSLPIANGDVTPTKSKQRRGN